MTVSYSRIQHNSTSAAYKLLHFSALASFNLIQIPLNNIFTLGNDPVDWRVQNKIAPCFSLIKSCSLFVFSVNESFQSVRSLWN